VLVLLLHEDNIAVNVKFSTFLCTVLNGGEWLASRSGRFCPEERTLSIHMERQQPPLKRKMGRGCQHVGGEKQVQSA
jgi:hypothetical protein